MVAHLVVISVVFCMYIFGFYSGSKNYCLFNDMLCLLISLFGGKRFEIFGRIQKDIFYLFCCDLLF